MIAASEIAPASAIATSSDTPDERTKPMYSAPPKAATSGMPPLAKTIAATTSEITTTRVQLAGSFCRPAARSRRLRQTR